MSNDPVIVLFHNNIGKQSEMIMYANLRTCEVPMVVEAVELSCLH